MDITIEARISATEDPERVRLAVVNLFPDAVDSGQMDGTLSMRSSDIRPLFDRISEQKIRNTARALLLKSIRGERMRFSLNRQAALFGRVNFTDGSSALGDLEVFIEEEGLEGFVNSVLGCVK